MAETQSCALEGGVVSQACHCGSGREAGGWHYHLAYRVCVPRKLSDEPGSHLLREKRYRNEWFTVKRSRGWKLGVTGSNSVPLLTSGVTFPLSLFSHLSVGELN